MIRKFTADLQLRADNLTTERSLHTGITIDLNCSLFEKVDKVFAFIGKQISIFEFDKEEGMGMRENILRR